MTGYADFLASGLDRKWNSFLQVTNQVTKNRPREDDFLTNIEQVSGFVDRFAQPDSAIEFEAQID